MTSNGVGSALNKKTNPINPAWRGNKFQHESDYTPGSNTGVDGFLRYYNSRATRVAGLTPIVADSALAGIWQNSYQRSISLFSAPDASTVQSAAVRRPDGAIIVFRPSGSNWVAAEAHTTERLARLANNTWLFLNDKDEVESYDVNGRLVAITTRNGMQSTITKDANNRPWQIRDAFERLLSIGYDAGSRINLLTLPDNQTVQYGYTGTNLTSVTYPGGQSRTYVYDNAAYPAALTGIQDESTQRYATWAYDTQGRATLSEHGASGSGIDRHTVTYNANGSATITDPVNSAYTYTYQDQFDTAKLSGADQPAGSGCLAATSGVTYSPAGFVQTRTDFNNVTTTYTHNTRGLETSRTEASGKPEARTISTDWHAYWRLPLKKAEPKKLTTYVYNGDGGNYCAPTAATVPSVAGGIQPIGVLCSKTEQATTDATGSAGLTPTVTGNPRTWTYTYNAYGQVLTENGPRTDVVDSTTYTYHPANDADLGKRGNLASAQNALGHLTQYTAYDLNGRVLTLIDPNGVSTTFTYWPRGWLKSRSLAGKTTNYDYTPWGGLERITYPDSSYVHYSYDAAHRLTGIADAMNRRVAYTLDNLGNRTREEHYNADNSKAREVNRVFDALGRLKDEIEGINTRPPRIYGYYAGGELKFETSPLAQTTNYEIDAHGRTTKKIDPVNGAAKPTLFQYDSLDQLTNLTAPNNAQTGFTIDGLGNVSQEASSDRGSIGATYDEAGNLKTRTDARSITHTYSYDALNRPTSQTTSNGHTRSWTWDSGAGCTNGLGRLCQSTDPAGTTRYAYDARGNLITKTRIEDGETFTTTYAHNDADRPTDLITPTAETIVPTLDASGKPSQIAATQGGTTTTIATNLEYSATGDISKQTQGSTTTTQTYDDAGRPDTETANVTPSGGSGDADVPLPLWAVGLLGAALMGMIGKGKKGSSSLVIACAVMASLSGLPQSSHAQSTDLNYDANGNVIQKTTAGGTTTYTYDALDRIDTEAGHTGNRNHDYDGNDNRTTDGAASPTTATYTPNSDRLATINGTAVTLDAAGNLTNDGTYKYTWDDHGNLSELRKSDNTLLASYYYDEQHRRTRKVTTSAAPQGASKTFYHYDEQGHLIAETTTGNQPKATYVWNGDTLTGYITYGPRTVYAVQTDHLGSPYQLRTMQGQVVWRWETEAYGRTQPNEDVDGNAQNVTFNLRFPGQYYDRESGLHYNWHRYYSPKLGMYISADPIGIGGGKNLYTYVSGNPINKTDPLGLFEGTTDCSYYDRMCKQVGGTYYCEVAPKQCRRDWPIPKDMERCIRGCLQDIDKDTCRYTCDTSDFSMFTCQVNTHAYCWTRCAIESQ